RRNRRDGGSLRQPGLRAGFGHRAGVHDHGRPVRVAGPSAHYHGDGAFGLHGRRLGHGGPKHDHERHGPHRRHYAGRHRGQQRHRHDRLRQSAAAPRHGADRRGGDGRVHPPAAGPDDDAHHGAGHGAHGFCRRRRGGAAGAHRHGGHRRPDGVHRADAGLLARRVYVHG